ERLQLQPSELAVLHYSESLDLRLQRTRRQSLCSPDGKQVNSVTEAQSSRSSFGFLLLDAMPRPGAARDPAPLPEKTYAAIRFA
ncbi:hypothetical protein KUCAC02_013265, partial [Chaenocephalus aceratus]